MMNAEKTVEKFLIFEKGVLVYGKTNASELLIKVDEPAQKSRTRKKNLYKILEV